MIRSFSIEQIEPGTRFRLKVAFIELWKDFKFRPIQVVAVKGFLADDKKMTFAGGKWWCHFSDIEFIVHKKCVCANAWIDEACCCGAENEAVA